jgi:ABC-type sugar transport system permease subunit
VKFIVTFVLSLLPHLAYAEATGGYGYGDDLAAIAIIIAVIVIAGIFAFVKLRSKGKSR